MISTNDENKCQCLICHEFIKGNKMSNIKRHFERRHQINVEQKYPLNSNSRATYIQQLLNAITKHKAVLSCAMTEGQCVTLASYKISKLIATNQRPFTEGEFVKTCFIESAKILFAEYKNKDSIIRSIMYFTYTICKVHYTCKVYLQYIHVLSSTRNTYLKYFSKC